MFPSGPVAKGYFYVDWPLFPYFSRRKWIKISTRAEYLLIGRFSYFCVHFLSKLCVLKFSVISVNRIDTLVRMTFIGVFRSSLDLKPEIELTTLFVGKTVWEKTKPIHCPRKTCRTLYPNNVSPGRPRQRAPDIPPAQQKVSIVTVTGKARGNVSHGRKQMDCFLRRKDFLWLERTFHTLLSRADVLFTQPGLPGTIFRLTNTFL